MTVFKYYRNVTINPSLIVGSLMDFSILFKINIAQLDNLSNIDEVRFALDEDGKYIIASDRLYMLQDSGNIYYRVKIPILSGLSNKFYILWGNASAGAVPPESPIGQYNAYDDDWMTYLCYDEDSEEFQDRTKNNVPWTILGTIDTIIERDDGIYHYKIAGGGDTEYNFRN